MSTAAHVENIAGLDAQIVVEREGFDLRLELSVEAASTVVLLGPNGAGKSTSLRALAGLVRLSAGRIRLGASTLEDTAGQVYLPPERRRVGVVFQDYLLFPHLTVLENVAFGLRASGMGHPTSRNRALDWLDRVGLAGFSHVRPAQLSGGQAQRVALARALVIEPQLLLLDEPLAALDAETRPELRSELAAHLSAFDGCAVIVSHDPLDALILGDRLVVLENGRVVQRGTPDEVARNPRTNYVARLMGLNLLPGEAAGRRRIFAPGMVSVLRTAPTGPGRASWRATVTSIEQQLAQVRVTARTDGGVEGESQAIFADVAASTLAELRLSAGETVWLSVDAGDIRTITGA
ncbi:MAG: ABC transporter ATP-binding protein [Lacisediminihabitans sp.]